MSKKCKKHKKQNCSVFKVGDIITTSCPAEKMFGRRTWDNAKVLKAPDYKDVMLVRLACGCEDYINTHWVRLVRSFPCKCRCCHCCCCS